MQKFIWALCGLTFFLIVWGAMVRITGSGLGCPDWPLCHGQMIPPFEKTVLIEYFHRMLATLVGLGTLIFFAVVWCRKELRKNFGKMSLVAVALLAVQVVLGGVTVRTELHPHIVATHLGVGLIFLAVLFYMGLRFSKDPDHSLARSQPRTLWYSLSHATLSLLFVQMVLGGLVAASNAGLACPDFPMCMGQWVPVMKGTVALHFLHRVGAALTFAMIVFITLGVRCRRGACPKVLRAVFILVLLQVLLGIGNVMMKLPIEMRVAHNAVAVALFLALMRATYQLRRMLSI